LSDAKTLSLEFCAFQPWLVYWKRRKVKSHVLDSAWAFLRFLRLLLFNSFEDQLALRGLFKDSAFYPARVVFPMQLVGWKLRSLLLAIQLIMHPMERQWLDLSARGHVKIRILVPTICVKEEVTNATLGLGRQ
jgi:hypothetical protein